LEKQYLQNKHFNEEYENRSSGCDGMNSSHLGLVAVSKRKFRSL